MTQAFSRRRFLKDTGALSAAGLAATTLSACGGSGGGSSPNVSGSNNGQTAPGSSNSNPTPPPPQAQAGTWIYEADLHRLTLNLGDVELGNCDIAEESKTFKIRALFLDAMFWAVPADDGTLFLQQWTRISASSGATANMAGTWTNGLGHTLTLNSDGTTNITHSTGNCGGYGYLGHEALPNNIFRQGVASGDPAADGFILWTRARKDNGNVTVGLEIATDPMFMNVLAANADYSTDIGMPAATTGGDDSDDDNNTHGDHTVKVVVSGLDPSTVYYYRFTTPNEVDAASQPFVSFFGRAKTLPATGVSTSSARFALLSCSSFPHGYFNAYRQVARNDDLDGVFHLGDYTYEYPGEAGQAPGNSHDYPEDEAELVRRYSEDNREETVTLGQYRRRFRNYREDIDLQLLHSRYWFINTWDDHETSNDSFDPDAAGTDGGAENHNDIATNPEGAWEPRKAAASQAYNEWLPISDISAASGTFNDPRLHRKFRFGDLADLVIMDTRVQGRFAPPDPNGPGAVNAYTEAARGDAVARKFVSDDQRSFVLDSLTQAESDGVKWKLLGQQVMMGHLVGPPLLGNPANDPTSEWNSVLNPDQWDGFDAERETIFDHIGNQANPNINNFVVLTGDIHTSWAIELVDDPRKRTPPPAPGGANGNTIITDRFGVEFVTTSITSPGLPDPAGSLSTAVNTNNSHIQRVDLENRGFSILDLNTSSITCTWFHIDSITDQEDEGVNRAFAYRANDGERTLNEVLP